MKYMHLDKKNLLTEKSLVVAVRIANITLNTHLKSQFAEILVLILEYAQLMSQAILLSPSLSSEKSNEYENYPIIKGVIYAAKLVNPSYLLSFTEERWLTEVVLGIILGFFVMKKYLIVYVICKIFTNKEIRPVPLQIFRWIYQTHVRVFYYFISSFFVRAILANKEFGFTFLGIGKTGDWIVCAVVIAVEFGLGFFPKLRLDYALPTKSLLASKDNTVEIITYTHKFITQILQIFLSEVSVSTRWILASFNLVFTVLRTYRYLAELPLYNIKGLLIQGSLVAITAALHLSVFMNLILVSRGIVGETPKFILLSWIILGLLSIKISRSLIEKSIFKILTRHNSSIELQVLKIELIKQFMKRQKLPNEFTKNNDWFYLLMASISNNINRVFDLADDIDFKDKAKMKRLFEAYLEKLYAQHPKNEFLKLYLAFHYAKKMQNFAKATVLILELQHDMASRLSLNASFLLHEIQTKLKVNYLTRKNLFDLYTYTRSQMEIEQLKIAMGKQVDLQSRVCEELLNHNSDLNKVFFDAQSASSCKQIVRRKVKRMMVIIPQHHVSPLLLCAHYNLIVNQSPVDYKKLCEMYHLRCQRYFKYFTKDTLSEENIYQENCALLVISGTKGETGKIIYSGPTIKNVCGGDPEWYIGAKIYDRICSPSLRQVTENFYKYLAEPEGSALLNQIIRVYLFHREGYLFESDAYLNPYPSVQYGYLIALLLRPKPNNRDFIIVRENGEIDGASRKICKRLGIFQPNTHGGKKFNINQVCGELGRVNNAMNIVSAVDKIEYDVSIIVKRKEEDCLATGSKFDTLFVEEARCLYTVYTEKGNDITLKPIGKSVENYSYFCKASNLVLESNVLRIFNLQEIENGHQSEITEIIEDMTFVKQEMEENEKTTNAQEWDVDEDEKSQGWIDFGMLGSNIIEKAEFEHEKDNETLGKKQKSNIQLKFRKANLPPAKNAEIEGQQSSERNALAQPVPVSAKIASSLANSTSSRKSNAYGMFEAMKLALETKHHSKSFKGIFFFSILLLILTIIIIAGLFTSLDKTIISLRYKKDTMNNAQIRDFYAVNLQTSIRDLYDLAEGNIVLQDMGRTGGSLSRIANTTRTYIESMALSNRNLMNSVDLLNDTAKREFYVKNVTIVFPNATQQMNSFQAIETLIQESLKILDLAEANQDIPKELFDCLNVNLMNDILVKSSLISKETVTSVQDEVNSMRYLNSRYFLVISIAISVLVCFLCFIIWFQYKSERNNLTQLTKLNRSSIKSILEQYHNFRINLLENDQISTNFSVKQVVGLTKKRLRQTNKSYSQAPNMMNLQKRFLLYGLKGIFLSVTLFWAFIMSMVFTSNSIDYLSRKLTQMAFMNQISNRVSFFTSATIELPISKGAATIWNQPILPASGFIINMLALDRQALMRTFLSEDLVENKKITQLLFGDPCKFMNQTFGLYRDILHENAINSSMTRLIGSFETLLYERLTNYQTSDKSAAALKINRFYESEQLISMKQVLTEAALLISSSLNEAYESKLQTLNERKVTGVCCALGALLVIFAILWVLVIKPIRESDNNFKKVLQIFPARVILFNFPFKIFLLRTSSVQINLKKYFD